MGCHPGSRCCRELAVAGPSALRPRSARSSSWSLPGNRRSFWMPSWGNWMSRDPQTLGRRGWESGSQGCCIWDLVPPVPALLSSGVLAVTNSVLHGTWVTASLLTSSRRETGRCGWGQSGAGARPGQQLLRGDLCLVGQCLGVLGICTHCLGAPSDHTACRKHPTLQLSKLGSSG